jgi:LPS-assembly lipoprotein
MIRILLLFLVLLMPACGFSPVYGKLGDKEYGQEDLLSYVAIGNIPDRDGQYLRNALIDRFYRYGRPENPQFNLDIAKIEETLRDLDITEDADTTRGQLRLDTVMILYDSKTGEELITRKLRAITSYNVLRSEFANRVSEQNTRRNALDDLARQIELQINLYFKRNI